jgi:Protein of unknown function (DUF1549)/Protein of unknown function (DUF1553)
MWARNLLFVGLVFAGVISLTAVPFPPSLPKRAPRFQLAEFEKEDVRACVERVNATLRREWAEAKLSPAPRAADLTIARRLSLGLTGRIPSLQEIRQFESRPEGERLAWWLAGIFEDRRFADYLAERLARAYVGTENGPFLIFRRRRFVTWLSDELLRNRPYDALVRELLTGEGLWTDRPATNFLSVTAMQNKANQPDPERLAGRVSRALLGIRLDCAQCHNHPFAQWKQADFQGLAGFFGQVKLGMTGIHDADGELLLENRKTGAMETIAPRVPFLPELLPTEGTRRQQLTGWITHPNNPYLPRAIVNRIWALLFGRPLCEPVDDISSEQMPAVLELLASDFAQHHYDLRRLIQIIASCEAFRLDSTLPEGPDGSPLAEDGEEPEPHWAVFPLTRLRPEQVVGGVLQASSLTTLNADTPLLTRLVALASETEFVKRYGDTGEDEFTDQVSTIPQRLLLMNGTLVHEKTKENLFNAATRISWQAPDDANAVRTAYLVVLTRLPTTAEAQHVEARLAGSRGHERVAHLEDLFWTLINSTEFAWNH